MDEPSRPSTSERPVGRARDPLAVLLLSIVTLGIYQLYWYYRSFKEMRDYSGEGIGGGLGVVLAFVCGLISVFVLSSEIGRLYERRGLPRRVSAAHGLWVLLPLVGWVIWLWTVQNALNDYWRLRTDPGFVPDARQREGSLLVMIIAVLGLALILLVPLNLEAVDVNLLPGMSTSMPLIVLLALVVVIGAFAGWLWRSGRESGARENR